MKTGLGLDHFEGRSFTGWHRHVTLAVLAQAFITLLLKETAKRLMTVPGVGPVTASAITATIQDMGDFASGREFAAFLGLTPRQSSTGGKPRLGRITKMGDRYLRKLLVVGACATLRHRKGHNDALRLWASGMLERKTVKYKFKLTAVALANKVARIVFVLMTRGGQYDDRPVAA